MIFPNLSLLKSPSLFTCMLIGKGAGLLIGIILFFTLQATWPSVDPLLPWGVLFWYVTVGAMIGLAGIYTRHPVLGLPLPWWVMAPVIGAWMNFVLLFFVEDTLRAMYQQVFGGVGPWGSPALLVVEGALIGLVIGGLATWLGGQGRATVSEDDSVV